MLLSNLPKMGRIAIHWSTSEPRYWCGGNNWSYDADHPDVIVTTEDRIYKLFSTVFTDKIQMALFQEVEHVVTVVKLDGKWITSNRVDIEPCEVKVALSYGKGFFIKDMGTTEQVISINNSAGFYFDIHVKGENITKVTFCGMDSDCFIIPAKCHALNFFKTK